MTTRTIGASRRQIQQIKVDRGWIALKVAGQWRSPASRPVSRIPNFFVFHTLAERLRTAAQRSAL